MSLDLRSSIPIVLVSIPSINILPSDGSINLNNDNDMVDFPDPVLRKKKKI